MFVVPCTSWHSTQLSSNGCCCAVYDGVALPIVAERLLCVVTCVTALPPPAPSWHVVHSRFPGVWRRSTAPAVPLMCAVAADPRWQSVHTSPAGVRPDGLYVPVDLLC